MPRPGPAVGDVADTDFDAKFQKVWDKNIAKAKDDIFASIKAPIEGLVRDVSTEACKLVDGRLDKVEEGLGHLTEENKKLASMVSGLQSDISAIRTSLETGGSGMSQTPPSNTMPNVTNMSGFNRALDPTLLFCNVEAQTKVARGKFHESILKLAIDAGLEEDQFDLLGDLLDNRFEIKWNGDRQTASSRCLQFFQSLQLGRGKWKSQRVPDVQGNEVQFFVGPDKNGAQVRREVLSKLLKEFVQEKLGGNKQVWLRKSSGTLFVDRRKLLTVHVTGETSARIEWYHLKRAELSLDQALVEEKLKTLVAGEGGGPSP